MTEQHAVIDTVVVGAGAAGFMAAYFAAAGGRSVVLLERTSDGGRKILISGGGRCNILPSQFDPSQYFTDSSPNILRNVLRSWPDHAQRRFFENDLGLELELEEESGKLFPVTQRAKDVRDLLVRAVRERGAEIRFDCTVRGVTRVSEGQARWCITLADGDDISARNVIIAAGGLSVPKTGSDGTGLRVARELGHTMRPTYAALTPLTLEPAAFASLAGISFPVTLRTHAPIAKGKGKLEATGGFLFTHRGYSGPSVLNVSHVAVRALESGATMAIDVQWTSRTTAEWDETLRKPGRVVGPMLRADLPERLVDVLLRTADVPAGNPTAQLRREQRVRLAGLLGSFPLPYNGHEGYRKAEVTGGGVALEEIDPRTMQSRRHDGLYFVGEVLDAFGPIGGYNFAWAWATGRLAGLAVAA